MSKSSIAFFFVLLVIVIAIARCNSKSRVAAKQTESANKSESQLVPASVPSPSSSMTPAPTEAAQAKKEQPADFQKPIAQIQPAVVLITVFEASGKLLKTGTGFFVSDDGKFVTSRSVMEGAAHAVAKASDGHIHNVTGVVAEAGPADLALAKAEPKDRVPFVSPADTAGADQGTKVAIIGSPLTKHTPKSVEGTILARHSDQSGEWLELSMSVPNEFMGSPVVNERGEVIGLVSRGPGNPAVVVRPARTITAVVAGAAPDAKGKWLVVDEATGSPTASPPKKIPLAQTGRSRLIYSPSPQYPHSARQSGTPITGSGRFRVTFAPNGQVKNIAIVRSTHNQAMDNAAVEALRQWKSAPGQEWTANIPITFQP